jgi:hypothetical protein
MRPAVQQPISKDKNIMVPAASLTNLINNVVSSNKGVLIADIYIRTTVYINTMFGFNLPNSFRGED